MWKLDYYNSLIEQRHVNSLLLMKMQGAYKNDFIGLEFESLMPGEPKLSGEFIVTNVFGVAESGGTYLLYC